jgi:hypothetical protein
LALNAPVNDRTRTTGDGGLGCFTLFRAYLTLVRFPVHMAKARRIKISTYVMDAWLNVRKNIDLNYFFEKV